MPSAPLGILGLLGCALVASCAGTTTRLAPVPAEAVEAEKQRQRELTLQDHERQQARLDSVAYPLLASAAPLCPDAIGRPLGLRVASVYHYDGPYQAAAITGLGVSDTTSILGVVPGGPAARAGLQAGDRVLRFGAHQIRPGEQSETDLAEWLKAFQAADASQLTVSYLRDGQVRQATLTLQPVCDYGMILIDGGELNAYADGENILLTSTMMRFTSDDELRVVLAHELAHNAMGHIKARKKNSLFGALIGALGDVFLASRGVRTGGYYTAQGAKTGATAFSQDFEREADYVGLYALAMAGIPLEPAPRFWRHMAQANPKSIEIAFTHPTPAERFVRMEQAIREIEQKRSLGLALTPEMKDRQGGRVAATNDLASALGGPGSSPDPLPRPAGPEAPTAREGPPGRPDEPLGYAPASATALAPPSTTGPPPGMPQPAESSLAAGATPEARSRSELQRDRGLRLAMEDVVRVRIAYTVMEISPGLLMISLTPDGLSSASITYNLQRLYMAYRNATPDHDQVAIELRHGERLYGWFTSDGLTRARSD